MKRIFILTICCLMVSGAAFAQSKTRNIKKEVVPTAMFGATYAALFPGFDTRANYGFSNTIGGVFIDKTSQNWLFALNASMIFGNQLKGSRIDILGEGITTPTGEIIGGGGLFSSMAFFQRGLLLQAQVGKLFPYKPNPNSGFFVQGGLGYLTNRIKIEYQVEAQDDPYCVMEDYQYGYDQMRGGPAFHLESGYLLMSSSKIYNCTVSLEFTYARTKSLRDYDFRVFYDDNGEPYTMGYTDKSKRFNDFYYGIRISWLFPTYQRQPEAYYYN